MRALDRHLSQFHFVERHAIRVRAPAGTVWQAIHTLTAAEVPVLGLLFSLRTLPARLLGRRYRLSDRQQTGAPPPLLEAVLAGGFVLLESDPPRELAVGTIGRFWQLSGGGARVPDAAAFDAFADPTFAKAALDFRLEPAADGATHLTTETRIFTPDPDARRRFGRYWRLIYPGSALIRIAWLRAIRRRAERAHRGGQASR